jgi:Arylmalonate decarboxylase
MAEPIRVRIGFVVPRSSAESARRVRTVCPEDVQMERVGLGIAADDRALGSLYDLRGAKEIYLRRAPRIAVERRWQGMAIGGAPVEVLNTGLLEELQARLAIPVTTAMTSCIAALKAFSAKRVLLLTPFDATLDALVANHLAKSGIEALYPLSKPFPDFAAGSKMASGDVLVFAQQAFDNTRHVDSIYFQGPLENQPILEELERRVAVPVVSSSLASMWYLLSQLGLSYQLHGGGRLLYEWPG